MKKAIICLLSLALTFCAFAGCEKTDQSASSPTPTENTEAQPDITEKTDYVTETWVMVEIPFEASTLISNVDETELDVVFTNRATGTKLTMPGFWNGGKEWLVRFAPTEYGIWDFEASTKGKDVGISGKKGTVAANVYKGDLEIYKRGFIKTEKNVKYFMYDDGTPFFYLGDTHWNMMTEEFDKAGPRAEEIETTSHFKYIVDRRVAQKFTVYQSEPIGHRYDVTNGITQADMAGFEHCDQYFAYIAQKGLVHANAMLLFPSDVTPKFENDEFLYHLTRYWVARYSAYPVVWTLAQEVDPYGYSGLKDGEKNIWITACKQIAELDPYRHPTTAHQANAMTVGAFGGAMTESSYSGEPASKRVSVKSAFYGVEGHSWWGVQWRPEVDRQVNFSIPRDYWLMGEGKVAVNYESRYEYLYTKEFGNRASAWISYLTGMAGYGYGVQDMWLYDSAYTADEISSDGIDSVTPEDKTISWGKTVMFPSGDQMTYLRGFMEAVGWYELEPSFDMGIYFVATDSEGFYVSAHNKDEVYVAYLYNRSTVSAGNFASLDKNATYTAQWFDVRTGVYTLIDASVKADANGQYDIPEKPVADDMVILLTKN